MAQAEGIAALLVQSIGAYTIHDVFWNATQQAIVGVGYANGDIQMTYPLMEGLRAGQVPTGFVICAQSDVQLCRIADLSVKSDTFGADIRVFLEMGNALNILPAVRLRLQPNGDRNVVLCTGETIGKYAVCGAESHILLKLGGGTAAIAAS
jgi:hypothetical protein